MRTIAALLASSLVSLAVLAQAPPRLIRSPRDRVCNPDAIPLMVVGAVHFDNPGKDTFNANVADVLTPGKQKEIAEVLDRLAAFAPTKIAIEAAYKGSEAPKEYASYLAGNYQLTRNEIDQIGYALARRLGHRKVYPVDFPMGMDGRVPAETGEPKPRPAGAGSSSEKAPAPEPPELFRQMQRVIAEESVLNAFRFVNTWEYCEGDHRLYVESLRPDPYSDALYGTTDPIANWYKRNLRIFTNIYRIAEAGDRILLLIGSGHNAILRQLAIDSGDFCLMETSEYLK